MSEAREEILKKLKNTGGKESQLPDDIETVFYTISEPLDHYFKQTLEKVDGKVFICGSKSDLRSHLLAITENIKEAEIYCFEPDIQHLLAELGITFNSQYNFPDEVEIGITGCEYLIAETGSVMVSSSLPGGRKSFIYPPIHVIIAKNNQLVGTLKEALQKIQQKYKNKLPSQISIITGPSRTADIEKTLILGAHGPRKLVVFILKD